MGSPDLAVFAPRSKLYTADLESGLHHLLRVELAAHRSLAGAELKTLKDFITVLAKVRGRLTWGRAPGHRERVCLGTHVAGTRVLLRWSPCVGCWRRALGGGVWSREEGIVRECGSVCSKGLSGVKGLVWSEGLGGLKGSVWSEGGQARPDVSGRQAAG